MQTISPERLQASKTYTNAFMALSQVAFSSVERLTALNLKVARAALNDGMAAANSLSRLETPANSRTCKATSLGLLRSSARLTCAACRRLRPSRDSRSASC